MSQSGTYASKRNKYQLYTYKFCIQNNVFEFTNNKIAGFSQSKQN